MCLKIFVWEIIYEDVKLMFSFDILAPIYGGYLFGRVVIYDER